MPSFTNLNVARAAILANLVTIVSSPMELHEPLTLGGVVYYYASSSLTVTYVDCVATDPMSQPELMEMLKTQLSEGTFTPEDLLRTIEDILTSPERTAAMTEAMRSFCVPDSAEIIAEKVLCSVMNR